jgi:NAD(P)-dependent dehydrogenase (short-subunit alcohol dehydrogenase family)
MASLVGKTALITGAASGIGAALSNRLAASGVSTILALDVSQDNLHSVAEGIQKAHESTTILPIVCDVTDPDALAAAFKTPGLSAPLSIVVNNAGTATEHENWRFNIDLNLIAAIHGTQLALETFDRDAGGVVINVASMAGLFPMPFGPVYTAAKHGLVGYSRSFDHLAKRGVRVNALCPAFVDTPLVRNMVDHGPPKIAAAGKRAVEELGGLIPMDLVMDAAMDLIENEENVGVVQTVTNAGGIRRHMFGNEKVKQGRGGL